jgi:hypothetical protein
MAFVRTYLKPDGYEYEIRSANCISVEGYEYECEGFGRNCINGTGGYECEGFGRNCITGQGTNAKGLLALSNLLQRNAEGGNEECGKVSLDRKPQAISGHGDTIDRGMALETGKRTGSSTCPSVRRLVDVET